MIEAVRRALGDVAEIGDSVDTVSRYLYLQIRRGIRWYGNMLMSGETTMSSRLGLSAGEMDVKYVVESVQASVGGHEDNGQLQAWLARHF